jgi:Na+/proline symporter
MNWRRGILLAAINLAVAVPLVVSLEMQSAANIRDLEQRFGSKTVTEAATVVPNQDPEDKGVSVQLNPAG